MSSQKRAGTGRDAHPGHGQGLDPSDHDEDRAVTSSTSLDNPLPTAHPPLGIGDSLCTFHRCLGLTFRAAQAQHEADGNFHPYLKPVQSEMRLNYMSTPEMLPTSSFMLMLPSTVKMSLLFPSSKLRIGVTPEQHRGNEERCRSRKHPWLTLYC